MMRYLLDKTRLITSISSISKQILTPTRRLATDIAKPNSENFVKDIIVFSYENPRMFRMLNLFSISQLFFWGYIGNWAYTEMKDAKVTQVNPDLPWYRRINLGESKYKNTIAGGCFLLGYLAVLLGWTFTLRSVRYLVLKKDGKTVSFVCYTPFGKNRIMDVPLKNISAQESRSTAKAFLPLKVRNTRFYYLLDMKGEFRNTRIFDNVVALNRNI